MTFVYLYRMKGNIENVVSESQISYNAVDDKNILLLINTVKEGIGYDMFVGIANKSPFEISEWCNILHLSERTLQRYKKENKSFDPIYSEKILEVTMLYKFGIEVFGSKENFNVWLASKNVQLGGMEPKELLDTSFGINLIKDELSRIEHGVLA
jgi:putative toxin-antitoxin system antitoxin component (TIGR02293 family)